ncbi:MAG: YibE/F family protein [Friedmanniella sp.]
MAHTHSLTASPGAGQPTVVDAAELRRHQRALRVLVVVLIPLAIWTIVGLIAFWPGDISRSVNPDVAGFSVPGVTYPTARITAVEEITCDGLSGSTPGVQSSRCANVTARILDGNDAGLYATVPLTDALYSSGAEVGQKIKLIRVPPADGQPAQYQFSDFERRTPLILLTLAFAAVVVAVARWRGFASLVGLGFAGFILVKFMFPALVAGSNPILIGLIGSSAIMFVVLYAAHGFSARTTTALVGTLFGLILIALLGWGATRWAHLTGVAAEDDYVLAAAAPNLTLTSVVMCGIIVAGLGVLNDVTITQASAVWELADGGHSQRGLFSRAMRIGRDHIASTVYTIAFATAGASLAVLLLIAVYDRPLLQVLQTEQFAGELIRTLVGSIGLVLAVPLTTAIGVAVVRAGNRGGLPSRHRDQPVAEGELDEAGTGSVDQRADAEAPAPVAAVAGGATVETSTGAAKESEAAGEGRRHRRRREKPVDDFGFADLRDPDEKGTGTGGRPTR